MIEAQLLRNANMMSHAIYRISDDLELTFVVISAIAIFLIAISLYILTSPWFKTVYNFLK